MNDKSCFLIIGYTPTEEKEFVLIELVRKLKKLNYKIILSSHNIPSSYTLKLVDHFIYDSTNEVINYHPVKNSNWYPQISYDLQLGNIRVVSNFTTAHKYHGLAAVSLLFNGLVTAKMLGFEKCHMIEYDSTFEHDGEFIENDLILNNYDSVHYFMGPSNGMVLGPMSSYNLNSYSYEELAWENVKPEIIKTISKQGNNINNGMVEVAIFNTLHKNKNSLRKLEETLASKTITTDLSHKLSLDQKNLIETIPFVIDNDVYVVAFYEKQITDNPEKITVIVNDSDVHRRILKSEGHWDYFRVCKIQELNTISVYHNDLLVKNFDFINDIDKEYFITHSGISKKN